MDLFDVLALIGGLCLFLFGMNTMGESLERRAGSGLRNILGKLTTTKIAGFLTGLGITAVIQSSSATTVMVVGFVNSGLMTLSQAINVIVGANIGTTVTAWILSLGGIESSNIVMQLLKPTSFTPVLALIGIVMHMFAKNSKTKDTGSILLGFATLMFGMDAMSGAVAGLKNEEWFRNLFIMFKNPILGVLAGAVLTGIIQSSSASVGILQAFTVTGQVSFGAAIPIIMGQNIGTCVTALISSVGATKNAKRAAFVHLFFNVIGTVVWLTLFVIVKSAVNIPVLDQPATHFSIAVLHSVFNVLCTCLLLPMSGLLEKLVVKIIPDAKQEEVVQELDERLLLTPPLAIQRCQTLMTEMARCAMDGLKGGLECLRSYSKDTAAMVKEKESVTDHYEDILGTYLVKLSSHTMSDSDSAEASKILKLIGDFERISDHGENMVHSAEEMKEKGIKFTEAATKELEVISNAVSEVLDLTMDAFLTNNVMIAAMVEPLEQVIEKRKEQLRENHIKRLQRGECTIEAGFVWSDLLADLERTSDHCSNIAGYIIDMAHNNMNIHESLRLTRTTDPEFKQMRENYEQKYSI